MNVVAAGCECDGRCRWLGGAFRVEGLGAAQQRRRRRGGECRGVTGFGAGDQDAFDGAIPGIADLQGPGAGGVQPPGAVAVTQPDDALDRAQPVDRVDLLQLALTSDSSATIATAPGPICSAWLRHQVTVRRVWATLWGG